MSVVVALAFLIAAAPASPVPSPDRATSPVLTTLVADSTPELFAKARTLARGGQHAPAMATYLEGARSARSAADWGLYRRDLALLASPSELKSWDRARPADRPALLESFWSGRDSRDGLAAGGRFAEHVRRVDLALKEYRVHPKKGKAQIGRNTPDDPDRSLGKWTPSNLRDYVPTQGELDDRGVIFVRHGEPDSRVVSHSPAVETWIYQEGNGNLMAHFTETLFDGSSGNSTLVTVPPPSTFATLCEVDQESCRLAARGGSAPPEMREHFRQRALAAIKTLTTTDDGAPSKP